MFILKVQFTSVRALASIVSQSKPQEHCATDIFNNNFLPPHAFCIKILENYISMALLVNMLIFHKGNY